MKSLMLAAVAVALSACAPVDEPVVNAAGSGVTVPADEALAAAHRAAEARASEAKTQAATATVKVK